MADELSPDQLAGISRAIYSGKKIEAIKLYRSATGKDLKDSKEAVEKLGEDLKVQNPAMFARQRASRGSPAAFVFWAALAALLAYFLLR